MDIEVKNKLVESIKLITFVVIYFGWKPMGNFLMKKFPNSNSIKVLFSEKVKQRYFYLSIFVGMLVYLIFLKLSINIGLFASIIIGFLFVIVYINIVGKKLLDDDKH